MIAIDATSHYEDCPVWWSRTVTPDMCTCGGDGLDGEFARAVDERVALFESYAAPRDATERAS